MPRCHIHATLLLVLLTGGLLSSTAVNDGTNERKLTNTVLTPLTAAKLTITIGGRELVLRTSTRSATHEAALRRLAAENFDHLEAQLEFQPGILLDHNWESASNKLLLALTSMDAAEATMDQQSIHIRGVTADAATFASRLDALRADLAVDTRITTDIVVVRSTATFDELCRKAFSEIVIAPVPFKISSAQVSLASYVTLDRITDFAQDCQDARISITGHTDATGDETWNRDLSLARAQAVADHIVRNGIAAERLIVNGLGSSQPIADNSTALGRELNRRIEFELR